MESNKFNIIEDRLCSRNAEEMGVWNKEFLSKPIVLFGASDIGHRIIAVFFK